MSDIWNRIIPRLIPPVPPPAMAAQSPAAPAAPDTRLQAPTSRGELRQWCDQWLGVQLPEKSVCPEHGTPLDYLEYVFFELGHADPLVLACRGGGKTLLGAVATLMDMLFKPGVEVRILAGSASQAERMYEHLVHMVERQFRDQLIRSGRLSRITKTGFSFANGSRVELLAQTETSVRGARVQKVRCDEVDLFDRKVWNAAQLTTQSKPVPSGGTVRGAIEALSTINGPDGVVAGLLKAGKHRLFQWCIWDVIANCRDECARCVLYADCKGKAHRGNGFFPVSDARVMRGRVPEWTWRYEMLCDSAGAGKARAGVTVLHY